MPCSFGEAAGSPWVLRSRQSVENASRRCHKGAYSRTENAGCAAGCSPNARGAGYLEPRVVSSAHTAPPAGEERRLGVASSLGPPLPP